MSELFAGLTVIILMILSALVGKRWNEKNTVLSTKDIREGTKKLAEQAQDTNETAEQQAEQVTKKLKEASNEEIVRMFNDAFTPKRSVGSTRPGK